jgi:peptidase inhibitor family I36
MGTLVLYQNTDYGGGLLTLSDAADVPAFGPSMSGQASSLFSDSRLWIGLYESPNFNDHDDVLWLEPPDAGYVWKLRSLGDIWRPHGTNNCNDLFRSVAFTQGPVGDQDNQVILYKNGSYGGNPNHPRPNLNLEKVIAKDELVMVPRSTFRLAKE